MTTGKSKILCILLLLLFPLTAICGLDWIEADAGMMLLINTHEDSAPSPLFPFLGVSIPIPVISAESPLYWDASFLFFFPLHYQYNGADDEPRFSPAEIERADTLWTLGIVLETRFGYLFTLSEKVRLGGAAGLAVVFRLPIAAIEGGGTHQGEAWSYFLVRSVYPQVEIACVWDVLDKLGLAFSLRGLFPIFHLWDGENLPFFDQFIMMANLGFRIYLN
jgi:hypothetical protein